MTVPVRQYAKHESWIIASALPSIGATLSFLGLLIINYTHVGSADLYSGLFVAFVWLALLGVLGSIISVTGLLALASPKRDFKIFARFTLIFTTLSAVFACFNFYSFVRAMDALEGR